MGFLHRFEDEEEEVFHPLPLLPADNSLLLGLVDEQLVAVTGQHRLPHPDPPCPPFVQSRLVTLVWCPKG